MRSTFSSAASLRSVKESRMPRARAEDFLWNRWKGIVVVIVIIAE